MQNGVNQHDAGQNAHQHTDEGDDVVFAENQPSNLLLMIAQNLERRVFACALDEIHQPHVVADDERQSQRDTGQHREDGRQRIEHTFHFIDLFGGVLNLIYLIHIGEQRQAVCRRILELKGGWDEIALAEGFPRRLVEIDALRNIVLDNLTDDEAERFIVAGQIQADGVADAQFERLGQLIGDGGGSGLNLHKGFVFAQMLHRLVVLKNGQADGARAGIGAEGDGFLHDALDVFGIQPAFIAFRRADRPLERGADIVIERSGVIVDAHGGYGVLQAERRDNQHRAAEQTDEGHERAQFVAHQVAHDHLGIEAEARPEERNALKEDALAFLRGLGAQERGGAFLRGLLIGVEQNAEAHHDAQSGHDPCGLGDRRGELIRHFILTEQGVPEQGGQGEMTDNRAQHRADGRRHERIRQIMIANLPGGEAQSLERTHLHALVVNHAREGRHDNQRGDGIRQHRKDERHVFKHLRFVVGARGACVGSSVHDERIRNGFFNRRLHGFAVRIIINVRDNLRQREGRNGAGIDQQITIGIRIGDQTVGYDDVLRTDDNAADDEVIFLTGELDADAAA